jgi:hypothetical protein
VPAEPGYPTRDHLLRDATLARRAVAILAVAALSGCGGAAPNGRRVGTPTAAHPTRLAGDVVMPVTPPPIEPQGGEAVPLPQHLDGDVAAPQVLPGLMAIPEPIVQPGPEPAQLLGEMMPQKLPQPLLLPPETVKQPGDPEPMELGGKVIAPSPPEAVPAHLMGRIRMPEPQLPPEPVPATPAE